MLVVMPATVPAATFPAPHPHLGKLTLSPRKMRHLFRSNMACAALRPAPMAAGCSCRDTAGEGGKHGLGGWAAACCHGHSIVIGMWQRSAGHIEDTYIAKAFSGKQTAPRDGGSKAALSQLPTLALCMAENLIASLCGHPTAPADGLAAQSG